MDLLPAESIASVLLAAFSVDSQALSRYSGLVKSRMAPETIRRTIEEEIAPPFSRERAKLDSLGRVPPEQERTLADLRLYLSLREAYWRQRAAAVGRTDDARSLQLDDADRSADEVMRRLLATR